GSVADSHDGGEQIGQPAVEAELRGHRHARLAGTFAAHEAHRRLAEADAPTHRMSRSRGRRTRSPLMTTVTSGARPLFLAGEDPLLIEGARRERGLDRTAGRCHYPPPERCAARLVKIPPGRCEGCTCVAAFRTTDYIAAMSLREQLCAYGRRAVELGLVIGTSGNLSVRDGERVVVTPSGVALDRLTPEQCPVVDLDGYLLEGELLPSSETPMHLAIYRATGAQAVVHTHSVFSTVVATTMTELPPVHYNALLLGGVVKVAEYATYGTDELAANVRAALEGKRAALMANHGGVTVGATLEEAFEATRLLEWLCEVYVRGLSVGTPTVLTEEQLAAVVERAVNPPEFPRR